ncbi:Phosphatase NudJ [BD1-7 clade bacterium]|uniref:Phosphatase NudJ n=1 Tax=BD1-7 clade bacterium TaxID=2029982 RepID=A0A5S9QZS8_9GAMM|nr:Phosphatase NudJ [BD1-7 clade bacterium]
MSWPPHITVASIICKDDKFLLVEEEKNGKLVFNQPAGHLEPGETLEQAAIRETQEESGWTVKLTHVLGVYRYTAPNGTIYYRHAYIADTVSHDPNATLDDGIQQAVWLTYDELKAQPDKLRSPLVLKNIDDYLAGNRYPLTLINDHE